MVKIFESGAVVKSLHGGLSVSVAIISFVLFKETLTPKKTAAILIGIAAIILLNIKNDPDSFFL